MSRLYVHPVKRRVRSIALLLLLSYLLPFAQVITAASRDPEAGLPACCRTHGKHKCFMLSALRLRGDDGSYSVLSTAQVIEKCPCVPVSSSVPDTSHLGPHSIERAHFAPQSKSLFVAAWTSQRVRCSSAAHQKRGPPEFLFFP